MRDWENYCEWSFTFNIENTHNVQSDSVHHEDSVVLWED